MPYAFQCQRVYLVRSDLREPAYIDVGHTRVTSFCFAWRPAHNFDALVALRVRQCEDLWQREVWHNCTYKSKPHSMFPF